MRIALASLLLATAVGFGSAACAADPPKPAPPAVGMAGQGGMGYGKMGHGMQGRGPMEMGAMQCMSLSDERAAALKSKLGITAAQTPQWNAFVDVMKANATAMRQAGMMHHMHGGGPGQGMMMGGPLPERLEHREAMMTAHLEALHKVRAAVSPLYDALTPDQKATADKLLCGGGMGGRHGYHGHHGHRGPPAPGL